MPTELVRVIRAGAALGVALAALAAAIPTPASAEGTTGALVVFVPADFRSFDEIALLPELAQRRGIALGLSSPSLGTYSRQQVFLDISQGSRISTRTYPVALGPLYLRETRGRGGRIEGFTKAVARAEPAPGEVVPGLFAGTVRRGGGETAYVGVRGLLQGEAIIAADEQGQIDDVSIGRGSSLVGRIASLARSHRLVVSRLPRGSAGLRALDEILARRTEGQMIYVMRAPSVSFGLSPTAIASAGYSGLLYSPTTRRPGLVTATDLAPTVLDHLGLTVPPEMQGRPVRSAASEEPFEALVALDARQRAVTDRRIPALLATLGGWLTALLVLAIARRGAGVRTGLRIGLLSLVWLPTLALVTAALEPSIVAELVSLSVGSLVLAAATDRIFAWPVAVAWVAALLFVGHAIDLALGSPLIVGSLAGPTPRGGARFYGIGNELETIMSVTALIGAGAYLAARERARPALAFALVAAVVAAVIGAGRLGADVGGVITLGAGGAVAVLASLPGRPRPLAIVLALLAPVLALAGLVVIDLVTGGDSHFSRFVLDADGSGELLDTLSRRLELAYAIGISGTTPAFVLVLGLLVLAGLWKRRTLLEPLRAARGPRAARVYAAGVYGALGAIVFGSVANDSGPRIFVIGAFWVVFAGAYARAAPQDTRRRGEIEPSDQRSGNR